MNVQLASDIDDMKSDLTEIKGMFEGRGFDFDAAERSDAGYGYFDSDGDYIPGGEDFAYEDDDSDYDDEEFACDDEMDFLMTTKWPSENPTFSQILQAAANMEETRATAFLESVTTRSNRPIPSGLVAPPPTYSSWDDFIERVPRDIILKWCRDKANQANAKRLMSGSPLIRISTEDAYGILLSAKGQCFHCRSLAVEKRPSNSKGHPVTWEHVGRRIGSLGHLVARFHGGDNDIDNLKWSCLWCNVWPDERIEGAKDHGAIIVLSAN